MRIMIMRAAQDDWYKHKIGNTYKVVKADSNRFEVKDSKGIKSVLRRHCEVIEV